MKNIEKLIEGDRDISIGPVGSIGCVAAATDGANCLAMLVRRDGERLGALMKRLGIDLLRRRMAWRGVVSRQN